MEKPLVDIYMNISGSITTELFENDQSEESYEYFIDNLEDLTEEFIINCQGPNDHIVAGSEEEQACYNLLDSLRQCIRIIESNLYDEEE